MAGEGIQLRWSDAGGQLRLAARHVAALAALTQGHVPDRADAVDDLRAAGMLDATGQPVGQLATLGHIAADATLRLTVNRSSVGGPVRTMRGTVGPSGMVGLLDAADDAVGQAIAQPIHRLTVTLWRLLGLGPRPLATTSATLDPAELQACFAEGRTGLLTELGADPAATVLTRLDVDAPERGDPVAVVVVDAGDGLWGLSRHDDAADHLLLAAIRPREVLLQLAALQQAFDDEVGA